MLLPNEWKKDIFDKLKIAFKLTTLQLKKLNKKIVTTNISNNGSKKAFNFEILLTPPRTAKMHSKAPTIETTGKLVAGKVILCKLSKPANIADKTTT